MEFKAYSIPSARNHDLRVELIPGHFATRHSHVNLYVNLTELKNRQSKAHLAALDLARQVGTVTPIDTIVCLEDTEVVGAFLAEAISQHNSRSINAGNDIAIITPEANISGQLLFRDNLQPMLADQNVLLLVASVSTGQTMQQAMSCIQYYSGRVTAIAALFSAVSLFASYPVASVFRGEDIGAYQIYSPVDCPECAAGHKLDALVNSYGYSRL